MISKTKAALIARLNAFLGFVYTDNLANLTNGAWEEMLDRLYSAMYGTKRDRANRLLRFNRITVRELGGVTKAQATLFQTLGNPAYDLGQRTWLTAPPPSFAAGNDEMAFELAESKLTIRLLEGRGFEALMGSEDFPTTVYTAFFNLLQQTGLKSRSDFYNCANEKCRRLFVPLRKPHKGKPAYCSPKCTNRVATIAYRQRRGEALKAEERERSHNKYKKRQQQKFPGVKVERKPRKMKPK